MSCASWALRFAASLDGILAVLSGMSNLAQMQDNLATFTEFGPVTDAERDAVARARRFWPTRRPSPAPAAATAVEGCPRQIFIPKIFAAAQQAAGPE